MWAAPCKCWWPSGAAVLRAGGGAQQDGGAQGGWGQPQQPQGGSQFSGGQTSRPAQSAPAAQPQGGNEPPMDFDDDIPF